MDPYYMYFWHDSRQGDGCNVIIVLSHVFMWPTVFQRSTYYKLSIACRVWIYEYVQLLYKNHTTDKAVFDKDVFTYF
jgi:hypothetical protein